MPKVTRTLTYEGDQKWLENCARSSFIKLTGSLGVKDRVITSQWSDESLQARATAHREDSWEPVPLSKQNIECWLLWRFSIPEPALSAIAQLIFENQQKR